MDSLCCWRINDLPYSLGAFPMRAYFTILSAFVLMVLHNALMNSGFYNAAGFLVGMTGFAIALSAISFFLSKQS